MGTFTTQRTINAPVTAVWEALADIGGIDQWNPGVRQSHVTSTEAEGEGACRYCDLGGENFLKETVALWEPERRLTMRITETNMPFVTADIRFSLSAQGAATLVTLSPLYTLKYGLVGRLLDRVYVRKTYWRGMDALLAGLKKHVETGASSSHSQ